MRMIVYRVPYRVPYGILWCTLRCSNSRELDLEYRVRFFVWTVTQSNG